MSGGKNSCPWVAPSAWELDSHASADQHVAGHPPSPVTPEYLLNTGRTSSIGHPAGTLPACHARRFSTVVGELDLAVLLPAGLSNSAADSRNPFPNVGVHRKATSRGWIRTRLFRGTGWPSAYP